MRNEAVTAIFSKAHFVNQLGVKLQDHGEGWCETALEVRVDHAQQNGFVHAGVLATIADHTAGAAAATMLNDDQWLLSAEFKINLLRAADGDALRCRATVLKHGRMLSVVESEVFSRSAGVEKLVAKATVTIAILRKTADHG